MTGDPFAINSAATIDYGVRCDASSVCGVGTTDHRARP
jgi:hypothetical protein